MRSHSPSSVVFHLGVLKLYRVCSAVLVCSTILSFLRSQCVVCPLNRSHQRKYLDFSACNLLSYSGLCVCNFCRYFPDGSCPSEAILRRFIELAEAEPGVLSVHCKAGLGRTGVLICCYIMKHYKFTANEVRTLTYVVQSWKVLLLAIVMPNKIGRSICAVFVTCASFAPVTTPPSHDRM